mmetsp:Transcript_22942/g.58810  ORF Transcript_22942/g.58810 Transcript_22942/m.58810 type:complete len:305 (+) Transcript_22942:289-1203(+)
MAVEVDWFCKDRDCQFAESQHHFAAGFLLEAWDILEEVIEGLPDSDVAPAFIEVDGVLHAADHEGRDMLMGPARPPEIVLEEVRQECERRLKRVPRLYVDELGSEVCKTSTKVLCAAFVLGMVGTGAGAAATGGVVALKLFAGKAAMVGFQSWWGTHVGPVTGWAGAVFSVVGTSRFVGEGARLAAEKYWTHGKDDLDTAGDTSDLKPKTIEDDPDAEAIEDDPDAQAIEHDPDARPSRMTRTPRPSSMTRTPRPSSMTRTQRQSRRPTGSQRKSRQTRRLRKKCVCDSPEQATSHEDFPGEVR